MKRLILPAVASGLVLAACANQSSTQADLSASAGPELPARAPDVRVGTIQLACGGESFRVAFEPARAVVVNTDGSNTELQKLEAQPDSPPDVTTYTNGMITFTRQAAPGKPVAIRYARGRMALQDCSTAQN